MSQKQISYTHTNSYSTLNEVGPNTKNIWLVFHGMGYLTKYFINYFKGLSPEENYIIAPQAPSKYYQDKRFKYVGASWLTKENTAVEKENVFRYLDNLWQAEHTHFENKSIRLILMGYSQGVSIVTRWMATRKLNCDYLLLHSGVIPSELEADDFNYLPDNTVVTYLYGDQDEYITEARKTEQQLKGGALFGNRLQVTVFKGVHEVHVSFIEQLGKSLQ